MPEATTPTARPGSQEWNAQLLALATKFSKSRDTRVKTLADAVIKLLGDPDTSAAENFYNDGYSQGRADQAQASGEMYDQMIVAAVEEERRRKQPAGFLMPVLDLTPSDDAQSVSKPAAPTVNEALADLEEKRAAAVAARNKITVT